MKLLKILTIIALVLFPFGEILRFDVGNNIALKPLDVVVGVAAVVFLFKKSFKLSAVSFQLLKPIIIFFLIGLFSLLISLTWLEPKEFLASLFYLLRWASYAALVGIVWQFDDAFKKKLFVFLFIDGLVILFAGFFQYFFFNHLKSLYHLGWDEHKNRIFSVFFDPNFAGAFFVLFFLFVGGYVYKSFSHRHPGKRSASRISTVKAVRLERFWTSQNDVKYFFLIFVLILSLIAVFLSFSRGALLSLLAGGAVFFILIRRIKLLFVLLGVMALFVAIVSPQFYDENMNLFRTASSKARLGNYEVALQLIQERPLLGVGFNAYRYAKEESGIQMGWVKAPSHADAGVDNSFLFVLATTGIVGLAAYLWMWFAIVKRAYVVHRKNIVGTVVIASVVALFVNAMFINSLFFAPLMLWMWILVGLMG